MINEFDEFILVGRRSIHNIVSCGQNLQSTAQSFFGDVNLLFVKLAAVCVGARVVSDSVPELLNINGGDGRRGSEGPKEGRISQNFNGQLQDGWVRRFVYPKKAVAFPNSHPPIKWQDLVITANRCMNFFNISVSHLT